MNPTLSHRALRGLAALAVAAAPAAGQTTSEIRIDLGTDGFPTNPTVPATWNDVNAANQGSAINLRNTVGALTGIQWRILNQEFVTATPEGTTDPRGALAAYPVSATRDALFCSEGFVVDIELSGIGPNTLVDLTFAATRLGSSDVLTADYVVQGFNGGIRTLDAAQNTSSVVTLEDVLPDASGRIRIDVRASASNTSTDGTYFLGILDLDLATFPSQPEILGFDTPFVDASRSIGGSPFSPALTVAASTGGTPTVALSAVDDMTGLAPTWLSVPGTTVAGTPFNVTFDPTGLPLGTSTAVLHATAPGFPDAQVPVRLVIHEPGRLNLLYYGNSYTQYNTSVPPLVGAIAEAAGHPRPVTVARLQPGQDLDFHLTDPFHVAAIASLPFGETWDAVVIQGQSLEATSVLGDPADFRADAVQLVGSVRAHSPGAVGVMLQTWARAPGSSVYPGSYADPLAMTADIRSSYELAVADIEAAYGPGTGFRAAAGDVVSLVGFDPGWYDPDLSHPATALTLATAMAVYQAVFRERTCDVQPDLSGTSNLAKRLAGMHLDETDWLFESGLAERCADPELRRYPGSNEDLLLASGVDAPAYACPLEAAGVGDLVSVRLTTPSGVYALDPAVIVVSPFPTGSPPGQLTPWPEVQIDPVSAVVVALLPQLSSRLAFDQTVLGLQPGTSLLFQGLSFRPSSRNPLFTTTDAHEVVLQ